MNGDVSGDRQRIADLERRMASVEAGIASISDQINSLRTDMMVGFARLETRQEAEDRARRHDPTPTGLGSIVATPERQAAAILGTMIAAVVAALLQLLGIELGS